MGLNSLRRQVGSPLKRRLNPHSRFSAGRPFSLMFDGLAKSAAGTGTQFAGSKVSAITRNRIPAIKLIFMKDEELMRVGRALVCLRYGIGDLVMELPSLQALRRLLPRARLTALGATPAIELLENDGCVDELVNVHDFGLSHWGDLGTEESRNSFREWLLQNAYDLVIDPSHAVLGAGEIIWQHHRAILDTGKSIQDEALARGEHGVAAIKTAVRASWGLEIATDFLPALRLSSAECAFAAQYFRGCSLDGEKNLLGLSPVASSALKRWPVERLAAVADHLLAGSFDAALLFCGPQRRTADRLLGCMQHSQKVVVIADLHLRQVAALLARCQIFICNDTGLLHLGAAVQVPVLGVFGPTSPAIYLPPGKAVAAAVADFCPHRKTASFGPPACLIADLCLVGGRGCIEKIKTEQLLALLPDCLGRLRSGQAVAAR
jgi:ADP-heptose:LPS heptosyltransferase